VFGRYEADRPNERWITDVLVGPWVPFPKIDASVRAKLFLIVDDHSRLLVDGRFFAHENARACQELLRRPSHAVVCPMSSMPTTGRLSPTPGCHGPVLCSESASCTPSPIRQKAAQAGTAQPLHPGGLLSEATHQGISSLEELNDLFFAWAEQVANRRVHAETKRGADRPLRADRSPPPGRPRPVERGLQVVGDEKGDPHGDNPLEGNSYGVDPALVGRRVELRYDPRTSRESTST